MKAVLALLCAVTLALPAAASAEGDPVMPLDQVHRGMRCTGLSVVHGTDISSFDVEVLDVLAGDATQEPRILVRVSGPAVDETGVGPGFSGSPIYCDGGDGVQRNIGAISEGIGEYGNKVALATPIEQILGEPFEPPASARHDPRALRAARAYALPLTISGVSAPLAKVIRRAAAGAGRTVLAVGGAPRADGEPAPLRPGSAFSAGYSSGDLATGAIGTVAYTDGDRVWGFGHPLDSVGRRDLFLQGAYVYDVVNNPVAAGDAQTYKLAVPAGDVGTLLGDGIDAVTGRLGALPAAFPLSVGALDRDTGRIVRLDVQIADETPVGNPLGFSAASSIAPIAAGQAAYSALRGSPARQSGSLCLRIAIAERAKPMGFCNTYVGGVPGEDGILGSPMVSDVGDALASLDAYQLAALHVTGMQIYLQVRRGLSLAYLVGVRGPAVVRRGRDYRFALVLRHAGSGARELRPVRLHISRGVSRGPHELVLRGTPADTGSDLSSADLSIVLGLDDAGGGGDPGGPGPRSVAQLAHRIAQVHRYDGVTAEVRGPGGVESRRRVLRDPELRISGTIRRGLIVRP